MERSLHRQLKQRYGPEAGGLAEVGVGGFRIDAVTPEGCLVEIQAAPLGLLKRKLAALLPEREVLVVKPVVVSRRIIRRDSASGANLGARKSPKRGVLLDVFDELVGLAHLVPDPNLTIELCSVEVEEIRVPRVRRPGFAVVDRSLIGVVGSFAIRGADDLWSLLPEDLVDPFTSDDLAGRLGRPIEFARRVAYTLRLSGAASVVARRANRRVYRRRPLPEMPRLIGAAGPTGRCRP